MKQRLLPFFSFLLVSFFTYSYTYDDFVWDFEWLEPNNTVEIGVGESHQLQYTCSTNYSIVFSEEMASNWVHIDLYPYQHVVFTPTGYAIDENGIITGKVEGKYVIHPTGLIQPKDPNNDWLWINVVSFHEEQEPNNILETANTLHILPTQFYLSTIVDVDCFKIHVKAGEKLQFRVKGTATIPMIKWATFGGTNLTQIGGGSIILNDGEQIIDIGDLTSVFGTGDYYIQFYANPNFYNYFQDFCYYTVQAVIEKERIPGDVNGDGEINIADVNSIIDVILGGSGESTADVNSDSEVNIADVNAIINIILYRGN